LVDNHRFTTKWIFSGAELTISLSKQANLEIIIALLDKILCIMLESRSWLLASLKMLALLATQTLLLLVGFVSAALVFFPVAGSC